MADRFKRFVGLSIIYPMAIYLLIMDKLHLSKGHRIYITDGETGELVDTTDETISLTEPDRAPILDADILDADTIE